MDHSHSRRRGDCTTIDQITITQQREGEIVASEQIVDASCEVDALAAVALGMWLADVASSPFEGVARTVVLWSVRTVGSGILFVCFLFGFGYLFDRLERRKTSTQSAGGETPKEDPRGRSG